MERANESITEVFNYVNHSLSFVEAKNGALTVLNSGIIIGTFSLWDKFGTHYLYWYLASFIPAILSLGLSLVSYYPLRQKKLVNPVKDVEEKDINMFRCESIAKMPFSQLKEKLSPDTDPSFIDQQRLSYVRKTSLVVARKYRLFRYALWGFSAYGAYLVVLLIRPLLRII